MSWLDEELARKVARDVQHPSDAPDETATREAHAEQQVRALDPLVQQLLTDYGGRAFKRSLLGRQFGVLLEAPGWRAGTRPGETERWSWHWHLHSYVRGTPGLEIHPEFDENGNITALVVSGGRWHEAAAPTEEALKAALVNAFLAVHGGQQHK